MHLLLEFIVILLLTSVGERSISSPWQSRIFTVWHFTVLAFALEYDKSNRYMHPIEIEAKGIGV